MLLVVLILSAASYRFFEQPMRRWVNQRVPRDRPDDLVVLPIATG